MFIYHRLNRFWSIKLHTMASRTSVMHPNEDVRDMKQLNKDLFQKTIEAPCLSIAKSNFSETIPILKKYILKLENFKAIQPCDMDMVVYLNPDVVRDWTSISLEDSKLLHSFGISHENMIHKKLTLLFENYSYETILKSVLPISSDGFSSFTKVGHILHLNLRDHLIPYKKLIGEVLLEKVKNCKSVVNKIDMIDNTYRNFQLEVLSGENNMQTCVKENGCNFEFDFSTVYWNSRLCTEHERIIGMLKSGDLFIDVFAGVGPFSIPLAKKKCFVYANDLNPESYKWLNHNVKINKLKQNFIKTFNNDGKDFIRTEVRSLLLEKLNTCNIYIAMNLPALAIEFFPCFIGLLRDTNLEVTNTPILYLYCFAKGSEGNEDYKTIAKNLLSQNIDLDLNDKIMDIFEVRTVSNFKKMIRISLKLDSDILFSNTECLKRKFSSEEQSSSKILKSGNGKKENE